MRGAARLACLGLAACSAPAVTPLASRPPDAYELPRGDALPAWRQACTGLAASRPKPVEPAVKIAGSDKRKVYEFTPVPLPAHRTRPTLAERSRAGPARSQQQVEEVLGLGVYELSRCWKWASARGAQAGTVELAFDVDPFGRAGAVSARSPSPAHDDLVACIEDTFAPVTPVLSPRTTRMRARVRFALAAQQRPWPAPPERPQREAPAEVPSLCMPVVEGVRDEVVATTVFVVDDRDASRAPHVPGQAAPRIDLGGRCHRIEARDLDKVEIRGVFAANAGAFGQCYRAARRRTPGISGALAIHVDFAPTTIENVRVSGPGDAAFHACVTAATNALWLPPRPHGLVVETTFRYDLLPEAPPLPAGSPPDAYFAVHDHERALAAWAERLARPLDPSAGCLARAGVVRTLAQLAPWLDDPRVLAATRDLARHAAALDPAAAAACLDGVQGVLLEIGVPRKISSQWSTLHRLDTVLPIRHLIRDQQRLHTIYTEQLIAHGRYDLARKELEGLETPDGDPPAQLQQLAAERPLRMTCVRR